MVIAAFVNFDILEISSREGVDEFVPLKGEHARHLIGTLRRPTKLVQFWFELCAKCIAVSIRAITQTSTCWEAAARIFLGLQSDEKPSLLANIYGLETFPLRHLLKHIKRGPLFA